MKVIGYARVSSDQQIDGTSLDTQARITKGLALTHDLPEPLIIRDEGVSGSIPLFKRPSGAIFEALGEGDVVIIATIDRLFRSSLDGQQTIDVWKRSGVRLIINGLGELTAEDNHIGKLMFDMMVSFANYERELIRERVLKGQRAKKAAGGYCGGKAPWGCEVVYPTGYDDDPKLRAKKSQTKALPWRDDAIMYIRELFEIRGYSLRTLVEVFNQQCKEDGWDTLGKSTAAGIIKPWRIEKTLAQAA